MDEVFAPHPRAQVAEAVPLRGGRLAVVTRDGPWISWTVYRGHRVAGTGRARLRDRSPEVAVREAAERLIARYGRPVSDGRAPALARKFAPGASGGRERT